MATITTLADLILGKKLGFLYQFTVGGSEYVVGGYYKFDRASCTNIFVVWNITDDTVGVITPVSADGGECYPHAYSSELLSNGNLAKVNRGYYIELDLVNKTVAFQHALSNPVADENTCRQGFTGHLIAACGVAINNHAINWCDPGGANWDGVVLPALPAEWYLRNPCSKTGTDGIDYAYANLYYPRKGVYAVNISPLDPNYKQVTEITFAGTLNVYLVPVKDGATETIYAYSYNTLSWFTLDGVAAPTPAAAPDAGNYYHPQADDELRINTWFTSEVISVDSDNIMPNDDGEVSITYDNGGGQVTKSATVAQYALITKYLSPPDPDGNCLIQGQNYGPVYNLLNQAVGFLGYDIKTSMGDRWSPNNQTWFRLGYPKELAIYDPASDYDVTPVSSDLSLTNPVYKTAPGYLGLSSSDDYFQYPVIDAVDKKIYFCVRSRPKMIWYDPADASWGLIDLAAGTKVTSSGTETLWPALNDSDIMHIKSIMGGHFIAISSRDQDIGLLTLDVAPSTAWEEDDLITGQTSGATVRVVAKLTDWTYTVKVWNGVNFILGEVLTNGTYTADQGTSYPTLSGDWIGRLYLFNVLDQEITKILTITEANADSTLVDIGILVEVGNSLTDNGHVIAVRGNLASASKAWRINTHAIMPSAVVWEQDITGNAFNLVTTGTNEYCDIEVASDGLVYLMVGTDLKSIDPADGTVSAAVSISGGSIPATSKLRWIGDTLYAYGADTNLYPIAGVV